MKIVIIGTSNSIIGVKGYINFLRLEHDVFPIICGRVPFFFHIKSILENIDMIKESDVLIIDHYVNDVQLYEAKITDYKDKILEFYEILSTINIHIVNLLFPIRFLDKKNCTYTLVKYLSKKFNFSLLDLNHIDFPFNAFTDDLHLNKTSSSLLGYYLSNEIFKFNSHLKPVNGKLNNIPYKFIKFSHLAKNSFVNKFKNSIMNTEYVTLNEDVILSTKGTVISLGYFSTNGVNNGVNINGSDIYLNGNGYFHDYIQNNLKSSSLLMEIIIKPIYGYKKNLMSIMHRDSVSGLFNKTLLTDLLVYENTSLDFVSSSKRIPIVFDMKSLSLLFKNTAFNLEDLSYKTVDAIRDTAISFEDKDLNVAYELMDLASNARPEGDFIKSKLNEYEKLK